MLRKNAKLELLKRVPLFSGCSRRELDEIAAIADELHFPEGTTVIREGAVGRELIVVVEGGVEVRRGGRRVARKDGSDFYGEAALLTGRPRNATVTTTSPVDALVITDRAFDRLLDRSPSIRRKVLASLAERVAD